MNYSQPERTEPLTAARIRAWEDRLRDMLRQHTLVTLDQAKELREWYAR